MIILEIAGWAGAFLYLYAYLLIVLKINKTQRYYLLTNAIAATGVVLVSVLKGTYQAVILNLAWLVISGLRFYSVNMPRRIPGRLFLRTMVPVCFVWVVISYWAIAPHHSISVLAWLGTATFLLAYLLFVNERLTLREFNLWNIAAPIALLPRLYEDANWAVFALETLWASAALYATLTHRPAVHVRQ